MQGCKRHKLQVGVYLLQQLTMDISDLPNLASTQLGAKILFSTDEWFAVAGMYNHESFFLLNNCSMRLFLVPI